MSAHSASEWICRVEAAETLGEFVAAADHAETALEELDGALTDAEAARLQYLLVRALARMGVAERAFELYEQFDIGRHADEDCRALMGRILKEQALEAPARDRSAKMRKAASAYEAAYDEFGTSYTAVNAATLFSLAGDEAKALELAGYTRAACASETGPETYWRAATLAEAALVERKFDEARDALKRAGGLVADRDFVNRASTRRQLDILCRHVGCTTDILDGISMPGVLFYAGHIIAPPGAEGRFPADQEDAVREAISDFFETNNVGFAFGSLAAGADLLVAEECMRRDVDLYAFLPFKREDFIETSVATAGGDWLERFETCYAWAEERAGEDRGSITYATDGAYLGDDSLFSYCAEFAMGLAILRARHLATAPHMLAVYDDAGGTGFGTDGNIEMWKRFGFPADIVPVAGNRKVSRPPAAPQPDKLERRPLAMLFGDVKGFSALKEELLPLFHESLMSELSDVLESYGAKLLYRNSWGDAIYAVFEDAITAMRCGLQLQNKIRSMDFEELGFDGDLGLRLSGHYGPVFKGTDYIRREPTYFGSHVTRTARIEPITPTGELFVTEQMAAALAMENDEAIDCDYMGNIELAKGYGSMRLYLLKHRV